MIHSAQNPQKIAWRTMVGIGATAMNTMPNTSVRMPRIDGAIMIAIVISAARRRSPTWCSTS